MKRRSTPSSLLLTALLVVTACGPKAPPEPAVPAPQTEPLAAAAVAPKEPFDQRVDAVVALLATGVPEDASTALKRLEELTLEQPDKAALYYNRGVAYGIIGDDASARKEYLRATDVDPTFGLAWLNMGAMAESDGDFDRALRSYRAGLRSAPDSGELVTATIGVLRKLGRYDEADRQARLAIKQDANNIGAYNNLGLVYLDQGKLELAQFVYQRAIMAVPGADADPRIHANLGRVFLEQDKRPDARVELDKALAIDPSLVTAMVALSDFHLENRDWQSTATLLEQARELDPDDPAIRQNLGIAYRGLGRNDEAERSYQKALDLDPEGLEPYLNLALLYGDHMQAFDKAVETIQRYRDLGGDQLELADRWESDILQKKQEVERDRELQRKREQRRKDREERQRLLEEEARKKAEQEAQAAPAPAPAPSPAADPGGATAAGGGASAPASAGESCSALGSCASGLECAADAVCREAGTAGTFDAGVGCMADTDCGYGMSCSENVCAAQAMQGNSQEGDNSGTNSPWGGQ